MSGARRLAAVLAAFGLVVAACSSGSSEATTAETTTTTVAASTTTTTSTSTTTTTTIVPRPEAEIPVFDDDGDVIPVDGAVTVGMLDNGITYYIRANDRPGTRAQLRLVVRAGSAEEGADQGGAAHYVEHMLFNGTASYPANDLIAVLQGFGSEFGPDINAYTSYEETVYELSLPTDRDELLDTGLDVLREWATSALIDPEEVDLERGVLLEEWRLRSQGFWGRYQEAVIDRLLAGSPYEGHETLAPPDVLEETTAEALRAFYDDWYRPDNLAIVAVGDFDVPEMEQMIIDTFGALEGGEGPVHPDLFTEAAEEPMFLILTDPEYPQAFVELNYPLPELEAGTVGTLRQEMAYNLAWDILVTRLREDVLRGDSPFYEAAYAANPLVRTQRTQGLFAYATPEKLGDTAEALLSEVERVLIHGFTQEELDRAVAEVQSAIDVEYEQRATVQDAEYASRYVEHFLGGTPAPDADTNAQLQRRLLEEMTVDQVTETFRATMQATNPLVIVAAPENDADVVPTEEDLASIIAGVRAADIPARDHEVESVDALMEAPDASPMPQISSLPGTSLEVLTFDNGARLMVLSTPIVENTVVLSATSFGGWSLLPAEDATEARIVGDIVLQSGVAGIDQLSLDRYLRDREAYVTPYIEETGEGIWGQADTSDLETLFQLLHLYMTEPQVTDVGVTVTLESIRGYAADPNSTPQLAASMEMADLRYGDPRFSPVPPLEDIDTFDADRALEVFRERFGDASDFVFVLSGDVEPDEVLSLARRYIGTLPSTGSGETYENVRTDRPAGVVEATVEAGSGEFGELLMLWDVTLPLDGTTRVYADLLDLVIRQRLTDRIREELSATYSPSTSVTAVDDPVQSLELSITISADPEDLDRVAEAVLADLEDLRENGPSDAEMAIAQEQRLRDLELVSNEQLVGILTFYLTRPDETIDDLFLEPDRVIAATADDLRDLARTLVDLDDYLRVDLIPE